MSDPVTAIVEGLVAIIGGGMQLDAESKERAHAHVREQLERAKSIDTGPIGPRSDAIRAKYGVHTSPQIAASVMTARKFLATAELSREERAAIDALVAHAGGPVAPPARDPDDRLGNGG